MKKHFVRAAFAAALLCSSAGAAVMMTTGSAMAEEQHVSRDVGKPLNDAIKAAQSGDFATATTALSQAEAVSDKTDYDSLKINQIKAFVAVKQKDYATAATAYEAIVASPAFDKLEDAEKQETLKNAMLLSGQFKHWPQVVSDAERLEKSGPLDSNGYATLAIAYYNQNDMQKAKDAAQKSVDLAKAAGQQPQQAALQIIMSAQASTNDQAGALKTLEQLAVTYGTPDDWGKLIDNALGTKGISELDALYLYRLRLATHAETGAEDYSIAAGIALKLGYPAEAQNILEQGIQAGKISRSGKVAQLMSQATKAKAEDERSLPQIAKAAHRSSRGEQDIVLAEDYYGYGRYSDAVAAANEGISKGKLKDQSEAEFILGISLLQQGQLQEAQQHLQKVDGSAARANAAHLWDLYAQSKQKPATTAAPQQAAPASQGQQQ